MTVSFRNMKHLEKELKKNLSLSTIDGISFYYQRRTSTYAGMWCSLIFIASIGCIALCGKGCMDYFAYTVRTNVHLDVAIKNSSIVPTITIPSLSFCGGKTIKKGVYHNDPLAREFVLKILKASITTNINAAQFKQKNDKYCPPTDMEDKPAETIDFQAFVKAENLYNEFLEMATRIFTSHHDMVLQCSWKGLNFPCNATSSPIMLSASYTDAGLCFMFQHDPEWVKKKSTEIDLSWRKSFTKSRPHELSLIFDLKQYQRCGYSFPYAGEGFFITAFDRRTLAQTNMLQSSSFRIQPGYEYKLGIKTVINDRLTEHLNRCTSKGYMPTDGRAELLAYTKGTCQGILLLNFIVQKCNCLPPIPKWFAPYANKENTGLNIDALKLCSDSMAGLDCLLKYLLSGTFSVLGADDRRCIDPCIEPTYKFFMNAKNKLTEIHLRNLNIPLVISRHVVNDSNMHEWIKKNIIVLHVDFESDTFESSTEIQLFTFIDLLQYIASTCGLFFGLSFISFFEILFIIISIPIYYITGQQSAFGGRNLL